MALLNPQLALREVCFPAVASPTELGLAFDEGDAFVSIPHRDVRSQGSALLLECPFAFGKEA